MGEMGGCFFQHSPCVYDYAAKLLLLILLLVCVCACGCNVYVHGMWHTHVEVRGQHYVASSLFLPLYEF